MPEQSRREEQDHLMEMSRKDRLAHEWSRLSALNEESDYVKVKPLDVLPNRPPEKYQVSFRCKGITGTDGKKMPIFGTEHLVEIYCHAKFPAEVPWFKWLTPIWHPNIEHAGQRRVCVNQSEWLGGMSLEHLCQQIFEMIQYKNYHADWSFPYPLDHDAAAWVRDFAEPNGIVNKKRGIYVDDLPFYRPTSVSGKQTAGGKRIHIVDHAAPGGSDGSASRSASRIKIQPSSAQTPGGQNANVVLRAGGADASCIRCGARLSPTSRFCGKCGTAVPAIPA